MSRDYSDAGNHNAQESRPPLCQRTLQHTQQLHVQSYYDQAQCDIDRDYDCAHHKMNNTTSKKRTRPRSPVTTTTAKPMKQESKDKDAVLENGKRNPTLQLTKNMSIQWVKRIPFTNRLQQNTRLLSSGGDDVLLLFVYLSPFLLLWLDYEATFEILKFSS